MLHRLWNKIECETRALVICTYVYLHMNIHYFNKFCLGQCGQIHNTMGMGVHIGTGLMQYFQPSGPFQQTLVTYLYYFSCYIPMTACI
jgi:hypothetical protein